MSRPHCHPLTAHLHADGHHFLKEGVCVCSQKVLEKEKKVKIIKTMMMMMVVVVIE